MDNTNTNGALPATVMAILNSLSNMNAEFSFDFDNIEVQLPAENPQSAATVRVNGSLRVRAKGNQNQA